MTRACWRTMACLLAAGLGGLAVWADDVPKTQAPPPAPAVAVPPTAAVPPPPPPAPAQVAAPPPALAVPEPPPPAPAPTPDPTPVAPPPPPALPAPAPEPPPPTPAPANPPAPPPPPAMTVIPAASPAPTPPPPPPAPLPTGVPAAPPPPASPFPWKLALEVVNGLTQVELRHGDELLMRVQAEKIDLHTPAGGLTATGRVAVTGPCVEARCDRLTIAWPTGQVALDGGVRLAFQNKGVVHEMRAEAVCFRLNGANQAVDFSAGDVRKVAATVP